jgi:hypothetical protein
MRLRPETGISDVEGRTQAPRFVRRSTQALLLASVVLTLLSLVLPNVTNWPVLAAPDSPVRTLVDVAAEQNLPTWFAVVVLGTAAVVHLLVAHIARSAELSVWRLWVVSAVVIAALSLDEASSLHERLDGLGRSIGAEGFPFAWVIPGTALGLAVVVALALLAHRVRGPARRYLVVGMALLVGAALGLEILNGAILSVQGPSRWYVVMTHVEELAEMVGAILLLRGGLAALNIRETSNGALAIRYGPR